MKHHPFFTIVTCTKNSGKFLRKNLKSVASQTFKDYEQIIIDGSSIDKTVEISKIFINKDQNVKLFIYPPKGISNAFNLGIKKSLGKYLFFLNSDDYLYDNDVLKNVSIFLSKNPDLDWMYGRINVIRENGKKIGEFPKWKIFQFPHKYLLKYINFIPHQGVFMKRSVIKRFGGFNENLKANMDYDLWLRIAQKTKWNFYDRLISNYTVREGSVSSSYDNRNSVLNEFENIQGKHLNIFEAKIAEKLNILLIKINKIYR